MVRHPASSNSGITGTPEKVQTLEAPGGVEPPERRVATCALALRYGASRGSHAIVKARPTHDLIIGYDRLPDWIDRPATSPRRDVA